MEVWDFDANGKAIGRIPVPVKLAYKEKVISMLLKGNTSNPYVMRDNENILPLISIQWKNATLDKERMRGMREKRRIYLEYIQQPGTSQPQQKQHMDMQTVPYILTFDVIIWARFLDHLVQIAENIDAFIHPEMYLEYYEKGIGIGRKIRVVKTGESLNFNPDLPENELRQKFLTWSYTFDVECNLYKPEEPVADPIKKVTVRYSAVTETTRDQGVDLGEQTVAQTVDSDSAQTSGTSGYCFYDYDANIVNYIRKFSDPEHSQIADQYEPFWNCQLPRQDIMPPAVTPPPPLAYGEVPLDGTTDVVTISSTTLQNAPQYIPQAIINSKTGSPPFTIANFENIQEGQFQVRLSAIPPDASYSIVWYAYQKYNSNPNDV
jgi:hypothetical protein